MKHTKGPWTIDKMFDEYDIEHIYTVVDNEGKSPAVARIYGLTDEQRKANARLISCAPEMLESLIEYVIEEGGSDKAKTIIERATGLKIEEALSCSEQ